MISLVFHMGWEPLLATFFLRLQRIPKGFVSLLEASLPQS